MPVIRASRWAMWAGFGAAAAMACGAAACSSAPPPETRSPIVEVAPVVSVAPVAPAAKPTGTGSIAVSPFPAAADPGRCKPDRGPQDSVIDAYFEVAKQHQLDTLLDCFHPNNRAAEAKDAHGFSHLFTRPGVTIVAHHTVGASGSSHYYEGKYLEQGVVVQHVDIEEGGKVRTLEMSFYVGKYGKRWFVLSIVPGSEI